MNPYTKILLRAVCCCAAAVIFSTADYLIAFGVGGFFVGRACEIIYNKITAAKS